MLGLARPPFPEAALCHRVWHNKRMPSINMRGLRDTKQLKAWLRAGHTVELRERDQVLGRIVPEAQKRKKPQTPDFKARAKRMFGDQTFEIVDWLIKDRWERPY